MDPRSEKNCRKNPLLAAGSTDQRNNTNVLARSRLAQELCRKLGDDGVR
jgi:hypothetical protein